MRKILVLRGGALGDFIVTLPALALLRERWPDAVIELVGNATAAQLARNRGLLDRVHSQHEARWARLFGDAPLPADFAAWLAGFDLVLSWWPDPEGELHHRFPLHPRQVFLSGTAMPACSPAAAHYCQLLRSLGIEPRNYLYPLFPVATNPREPGMPVSPAASTVRPVVIHPGSGSPRKNWPVENWRRLIERLPAPVSLILGDAEIDSWNPLAGKGFRGSRVESVSPEADATLPLVNAPLEELVAHLSRCRLFLGHDSGISHLAAACGARCVLLFGPTDPARWAPPAANVRVLRRGNALSAISVEDVLPWAQEALADRT